MNRSSLGLALFDEEIVRVAVAPAFARFERADHRVRCRAVVLGGVLVLGVVAASDVSAFQAEPEMHPRVTGGETFLAALRSFRAVVPGSTKMNAQRWWHKISLRYVVGC